MRALLCTVVLALTTAIGAEPSDRPVAAADDASPFVATLQAVGNRSLPWLVRLPTTKPIPLLTVPVVVSVRTALLRYVENPVSVLRSPASVTLQRATR